MDLSCQAEWKESLRANEAIEEEDQEVGQEKEDSGSGQEEEGQNLGQEAEEEVNHAIKDRDHVTKDIGQGGNLGVEEVGHHRHRHHHHTGGVYIYYMFRSFIIQKFTEFNYNYSLFYPRRSSDVHRNRSVRSRFLRLNQHMINANIAFIW